VKRTPLNATSSHSSARQSSDDSLWSKDRRNQACQVSRSRGAGELALETGPILRMTYRCCIKLYFSSWNRPSAEIWHADEFCNCFIAFRHQIWVLFRFRQFYGLSSQLLNTVFIRLLSPQIRSPQKMALAREFCVKS
jgi:hypothetical protein